MPFLLRYDLDRSHPRVGAALRDLLVRAVLPGVVVFLAILGFGKLLVGPLRSWGAAEEPLSADLESGRTGLWDSITQVWSHIGNTEYVIGVCVIVVALVWWRTRQWWYAVIPGIAVALQASIFVAATNLTDRPRPQVDKLDPAPPTSSYPSGHVGASTALYLSLALLAHRIEHPGLRRCVQTVCVLIPLLVAYARVYRGMHHLIDVVVGLLNGIVCALLAWAWLRRSGRRSA